MNNPSPPEKFRSEATRAEAKGTEPGSATGLVVLVTTALLVGWMGISDGAIEPGNFSYAGALAGFALLLGALLYPGLTAAMPRGARVGFVLLALLGLLSAASATWAPDPGEAIDVAVRTGLYASLFALAAFAVRGGCGRELVWGIASGTSAVVVVALVGRLVAGELAPDAAAEIREVAGGRLTAPVGYWNALGVVAASAIVSLGWLAATTETGRLRSLAIGFMPPAILALAMTSSRGAAVGLVAGYAVLIAASAQRGPVIGFGLIAAICAAPAVIAVRLFDALRLGLESSAANSQGIAVLVAIGAASVAAILIAARRSERLRTWQPRPPGRVLVLAGVAVILVALAVAVLTANDDTIATEPGEQAGQVARESDSYRVSYWRSALDAWTDNPAKGVGAGGFAAYWLEDPREDQPVKNTHSLLLEPLSELGILGFAFMLGFVGLVAAAGIARLRSEQPADPLLGAGAGLFAVVLAPALVDWTWQVPAASAGLLAGAALMLTPPGSAVGEKRLVIRVFTLAFALVALAGGLSTYLRITDIETAREHLAAGEYEQAVDAAEDADRWAPWSADGLEHEAAALAADDKLIPAQARIGKAISRAEGNWLLWLEAGQIAKARGRTAHAKALYDEATARNSFLDVEQIGESADNTGEDDPDADSGTDEGR